MGVKIGRTVGRMTNTDELNRRLVRLPLWIGLDEHMPRVPAAVLAVLDDWPVASVAAKTRLQLTHAPWRKKTSI
jgi:hypothetical protein